ncbi:MAG: hypothetical protein Ct9H300mP20_07410 [Gammaproteobacteria bacterium]|nr:MAG: hypothetical protein Ct9H300mP20_07410 [Gammaproteobacteria bacterium]
MGIRYSSNLQKKSRWIISFRGVSMDIAGPVITQDQLIVVSGYGTHGQLPGNVLLVFELEN